MRARHAVLPTRSVSSRPTHLRTSSQSAYESPQIPFFVFKRLRTLSFSVSSKSCVWHSYGNCRVCTNNSQTGTHYSPISNHHCTQVLFFHALAHSFRSFARNGALQALCIQSLAHSLSSQRGWWGYDPQPSAKFCRSHFTPSLSAYRLRLPFTGRRVERHLGEAVQSLFRMTA